MTTTQIARPVREVTPEQLRPYRAFLEEGRRRRIIGREALRVQPETTTRPDREF